MVAQVESAALANRLERLISEHEALLDRVLMLRGAIFELDWLIHQSNGSTGSNAESQGEQ